MTERLLNISRLIEQHLADMQIDPKEGICIFTVISQDNDFMVLTTGELKKLSIALKNLLLIPRENSKAFWMVEGAIKHLEKFFTEGGNNTYIINNSSLYNHPLAHSQVFFSGNRNGMSFSLN